MEKRKRRSLLKYRMTDMEISILFEELSLMLEGGIDLIAALELLVQGENKKKKKILSVIEENLLKGRSLSKSIEKTKSFPTIVSGMVEAAEASGDLARVLRDISLYYKNEASLKKKISNALAYPLILGITSILVTHIILKYVFPIFLDIFSSSKVDLPWSTKLLISLSTHLNLYASLYLGLLVLALFLLLISERFPPLKEKLDRLSIKIPYLGYLLKKKFELVFINSMMVQVGTGVDILTVLDNAERLSDNTYIKKKVFSIRDRLSLGESLSSAMEKEGIFSGKTCSLLALGEESSKFYEILEILSKTLQEAYEDRIEKLNIYLEPLLIFFMSALVAFIVFSIAIPMFDLVNQI